jgi:hypothetical protein
MRAPVPVRRRGRPTRAASSTATIGCLADLRRLLPAGALHPRGPSGGALMHITVQRRLGVQLRLARGRRQVQGRSRSRCRGCVRVWRWELQPRSLNARLLDEERMQFQLPIVFINLYGLFAAAPQRALALFARKEAGTATAGRRHGRRWLSPEHSCESSHNSESPGSSYEGSRARSFDSNPRSHRGRSRKACL